MPRERLTETGVLRLPCKPKPYRVQDAYSKDAVSCLHVLVNPSGTRTYRVELDRTKCLKIGRVEDMTLAEARAKAIELRRLHNAGVDVRADLNQARAAASATFKHCVEMWTRNEQRGRKQAASADRTQKFLLSSCKVWWNRPVQTLTYADIEGLLCEIRDGGNGRKPAPYSALRIHAHLRCFFKWLARTKRIPTNPMLDMPKPWLGAQPRERDWFNGAKADEMIRRLWAAADQIGGEGGRFIKILLITGKRRATVEMMRWEDIDDTWFWKPPKGNKSKRNHAIPLPRLAQRILSPRKYEGRVLGSSNTEKLMSEVRKLTGEPTFIWHGIRHLMETRLGELDVDSDTRDRLLDHAPRRGTGRVYDHGTYREKNLAALELWSSHIEGLIQPSDQVRVLR